MRGDTGLEGALWVRGDSGLEGALLVRGGTLGERGHLLWVLSDWILFM